MSCVNFNSDTCHCIVFASARLKSEIAVHTDDIICDGDRWHVNIDLHSRDWNLVPETGVGLLVLSQEYLQHVFKEFSFVHEHEVTRN